MIALALAALALLVLSPVLFALVRRLRTQGARELAVSLHRTQLQELDRDLAEGRILPAEHATAVLEVQRRLLAAASAPESEPRRGARWPIAAALVLVPLGGLALYRIGGQPGMPSVTGPEMRAQVAQEDALIAELRRRLAAMNPADDRRREGYVLLGAAEAGRGHYAQAAEAWRTALRIRFDPTLAARAAEASVQAEGGVSASSAELFQRALQAAPDAPWREAVRQRLQEPRLP